MQWNGVLLTMQGTWVLFREDSTCHWITKPAAAAAKSLQLCPILCDSIDGSPPGFSVPGILQARTLEWVAISFSWKWECMKVKSESEVAQLCLTLVTPQTTAYQAPPSMGFSRQEYWCGVPSPSLSLRLQLHKNPYEFYIKKTTDFHFGQLKNRLSKKKKKTFISQFFGNGWSFDNW